ncbi:hypothetical protein U5A82_08610 [Sphingobium sp. CR2-8]|uniref:hypothetical protein n=1 Tax=Sphingobium sp. CR2-8 TaxID=1306534 RepID=UPI002DBFF85F|nr:hypothetical protein [Sphingobium sp. CR2-8]MEC3910543.1 hypothetical protein [Sphingobium sp. CR2-8]
MTKTKRKAIGLAAWLLVGSIGIQARAQEIAPADRSVIESRIADFDAAMKAGRVAQSVDFIPPRLLRVMAEKVGLPEGKLKEMVAAQAFAAVDGMTFLSFGMDMSAAKVATTPDRSRTYMLIPTQSVIAIPDAGKIQSKTSTLALKDDGQWFLVRIDNAQQVALLRAAYPEFTGVDFPSGSTAIID